MQRVPGRPLRWQWSQALLLASAALAAPFIATAQAGRDIQPTQSLSFGTFVAGNGGTVTVSPSGARGKTGGVVLVNQGAAATQASFTVTGTANTSYSITLPADGSVTLSSGTHAMAVNAFTSQPIGSAVIPASGSAVLNVGARLSVGAGQPSAHYDGSFGVTLNYE